MRRSTKLIYWFTMYAGVYIIILLLLFKKIPLLAAILMLDLCFWCVSSCFSRVYQKQENGMLELLSEYRLTEFIETYGKAHAKDTKKGPSSIALLNLATAYMHLGDMETSMRLFRQAEPADPQQLPRRKRIQFKYAVTTCAVYYNNLACACLRCHDPEQAQRHMETSIGYLAQIRVMAEKYRDLEDFLDTLSRDLCNRRLELSLERGEEPDTEKELEQLQRWFDEASKQSFRVYNRYLASVLYERAGNREEAENCRSFVRENGGESCYVKWVEETEDTTVREEVVTPASDPGH